MNIYSSIGSRVSRLRILIYLFSVFDSNRMLRLIVAFLFIKENSSSYHRSKFLSEMQNPQKANW